RPLLRPGEPSTRLRHSADNPHSEFARRGPEMARNTPHPATLAAQALGWIDDATGAVVLPVHTATTFLRDPDNQYRRGRGYGRADNASFDQPEALITALEGGAASLVLASGMAAAMP